MTARGGLLVVDLDGTLLIGDGPALDHARELAGLADRRVPGAGTRLLGEVEAFLAAGGSPIDAPDGYLAARSLALDAGLTRDDVSRAFLAHRARMASGEVPFHAPPGARALLDDVRSTARVALVTNAPASGLPAIIAALGLDGAFDDVVGDAGKPSGLPGIVDDLLRGVSEPGDFRRVLSIGDIWENDLAPLASGGATTAHIDRHATGAGTPSLRAADFGGLAPAIRDWASGLRGVM